MRSRQKIKTTQNKKESIKIVARAGNWTRDLSHRSLDCRLLLTSIHIACVSYFQPRTWPSFSCWVRCPSSSPSSSWMSTSTRPRTRRRPCGSKSSQRTSSSASSAGKVRKAWLPWSQFLNFFNLFIVKSA